MTQPHNVQPDFVAYCSACGDRLEHDGDSYRHSDESLDRCGGLETYEQADARQCILVEGHDGECDFGGREASDDGVGGGSPSGA